VEVPWGGSLGMDAERAPLGHGWPVGACPPHGAGAKEPPRSGGRTPAQWFWLLLPKCTDRIHRLHVYGDMVNTFWRTHFAGKPSCLGIREMP